MRIKCMYSKGQCTITCEDTATLSDLQSLIENETSIKSSHQKLRFRLPAKDIDTSNKTAALKSLGISTGECLCLEECEPSPPQRVSSGIDQRTAITPLTTTPEPLATDMFAEGEMVRCVVPADNSCLFNSIALVCEGDRSRTGASHLRGAVADYILTHRDQFCAAMLDEQEPEAYCEWIQNTQHWGGSIELSTLSTVLQVQIGSVDIQTTRADVYGKSEGYPRIVYVIYDGIHYDAIGFRFCEGIEEDGYITVFHPDDALPLQKTQEVARKLKSSRQFTDVHKFSLQCMICGAGLVGQKEAAEHGKSTGHANFQEYPK